MTITEDFETNFETNFLKNENLFYKTGVSFVVKSTTIESVTYPYKTVLSEANVMTNRMRITKWTYLIFILFVSTGVLFERTFSL